MIINKMVELSKKTTSNRKYKEYSEPTFSAQIASAPKILAREPMKFKFDKAGYFVIISSIEKKIIIVEHYTYDNKLLRTIEGKDAPSIYSTIIENGWITELNHAAYLGRELAKAEFSLGHKVKYIQDKAPGKITEEDELEMDKNNKLLKIFTVPQQFPCGPTSSCCGPIGLTEEEVDSLVNTVKKVFAGEIAVFNLGEKDVQKDNKQVVSLVASLGWGCLPIISLDSKIISVGKPSSEQELLETVKSHLSGDEPF